MLVGFEAYSIILSTLTNVRIIWRRLGNEIGLLVNSNFKGENLVSKIVRNNRADSNKAEITDQFNKHFAYVSLNQAKNILHCEDSPSQFIKSTPVGSFVMSSFVIFFSHLCLCLWLFLYNVWH